MRSLLLLIVLCASCKESGSSNTPDAGANGGGPDAALFACTLTSPPTPPPWPDLTSYAAALGDVDRDGIVDLVTIGWVSDQIHVRRGLGDGTFSTSTQLDFAAADDLQLALVDLDGDAKLDLLLTSRVQQPSHTMSIHAALGNGDGTFQPRSTLFERYSVAPPTVADFNNDGRPDLAFTTRTSSSASDEVHVALATASGAYTDATVRDAEGFYVAAASDLDRDGDLDLVLTRYSDGVQLYPGRGDGTFDSPRLLSAGRFLALVDIDKDGDDDLIEVSSIGAYVQLNRGDGTFGSSSPFETAAQPYAAATGDFDGDGKVDIAMQKTVDRWALYPGVGDGTFAPGVVMPTALVEQATAADLNGDGLDDLFLFGYRGTSVHMGARSQSFQMTWKLFEDNWGTLGAVGDVNKDALLDVATSAQLHLGTDDNGLRPSGVRPGTSVALTDMNADGNLDLVYGLFATIHARFGRGDGTFDEPVATSVTTPQAANQGSWNVITDHDGDGIVDAVLAMEVYRTSSSPARTYVALGKGAASGTFALQAPYSNFGGDCQPFSFWISGSLDANNDGHRDLLVNCSQSTHIALGDGTGQFSDVAAISTGAKRIESGDLNSDGIADLVLAWDTIQVLFGNGDGTFQPAVVDSRFNDARSVGVADINGDGKRDLMVGRDNHVTLLINNGDGTFEVGPEYVTHLQTSSLMAADLGGDGRPEILAVMREFVAVFPSPCEPRVAPSNGGTR